MARTGARHAVRFVLCTSAADSGKHANSFSYACEKVQAALHAQKGEGFGERGSHARHGGRADLQATGLLDVLFPSFFRLAFLMRSRMVLGGLFRGFRCILVSILVPF